MDWVIFSDDLMSWCCFFYKICAKFWEIVKLFEHFFIAFRVLTDWFGDFRLNPWFFLANCDFFRQILNFFDNFFIFYLENFEFYRRFLKKFINFWQKLSTFVASFNDNSAKKGKNIKKFASFDVGNLSKLHFSPKNSPFLQWIDWEWNKNAIMTQL